MLDYQGFVRFYEKTLDILDEMDYIMIENLLGGVSMEKVVDFRDWLEEKRKKVDKLRGSYKIRRILEPKGFVGFVEFEDENEVVRIPISKKNWKAFEISGVILYEDEDSHYYFFILKDGFVDVIDITEDVIEIKFF